VIGERLVIVAAHLKRICPLRRGDRDPFRLKIRALNGEAFMNQKAPKTARESPVWLGYSGRGPKENFTFC
jgi:hypothetical protein